jgi:hypothetical protein
VGSGCVYDDSVNTLPLQLTVANLSWKGYMDGMATPCQHPTLDLPDPYQQASPTQEYATRHDPFMYFHTIIDQPTYCAAHVVPLTQLATDLRHGYSTPNLSYITPDLCDDGHDAPCADGRPGGLTSADAWMREWVPRILHSKAFKKDGLLVITADEAENEDATACCGEIAGPNAPMPGVTGPGGGRVGALVLSPLVKRGSTSSTAYNHYSLLASIEAIFHLDPIGFASTAPTFGKDVYNKRPHRRHHHG